LNSEKSSDISLSFSANSLLGNSSSLKNSNFCLEFVSSVSGCIKKVTGVVHSKGTSTVQWWIPPHTPSKLEHVLVEKSIFLRTNPLILVVLAVDNTAGLFPTRLYSYTL
jgi:hypothetical protein